MDNWRVSKTCIYDVHKSLVKKICAGRCWARKTAVVLCSIYWTCPGALYYLDVIVGQ